MGFEKRFTTHFLPHGHRKKMSAFLFPFSTLLVNIFHAEHLVRFFNDHPLIVTIFFYRRARLSACVWKQVVEVVHTVLDPQSKESSLYIVDL